MIEPIDLYQRKTRLQQLARLVAVRHDEDLNELGVELIDNAIDALALECADVGAAGQAQRILESIREARGA